MTTRLEGSLVAGGKSYRWCGRTLGQARRTHLRQGWDIDIFAIIVVEGNLVSIGAVGWRGTQGRGVGACDGRYRLGAERSISPGVIAALLIGALSAKGGESHGLSHERFFIVGVDVVVDLDIGVGRGNGVGVHGGERAQARLRGQGGREAGG